MPVLHIINAHRARDRTQRRRRVPVLWPWLLVAVAWAVLVLAILAHQTFLLDHHYLLQASGLPWLAAFEVFLLAGDDRCHDAALQYANGPTAGVCRAQT